MKRLCRHPLEGCQPPGQILTLHMHATAIKGALIRIFFDRGPPRDRNETGNARAARGVEF